MLFFMQKSADPDVFSLLDMNDKGVTSFSYWQIFHILHKTTDETLKGRK